MWTRDGSLTVAIGLLAGCLAMGCSDAGAPALEGGEAMGSEPMAATDAQPTPPATIADLFPAGGGRDLVLNTCGACHAVACSVIGQRTATRWNSLKNDHRDKVSNLAEEDLESIFTYLTENFDDSKPEPMVPSHFLEGGCTPF